ncbi:carbamoyl phosphate synthase small subunit [Microaerobacter geothermalis]|uniref:carbamoyl phosphate synthase small subunit n=1 Tax=Microaerobacter geothermalis TaxID=674972 RepID=UPI001F221BEB|nr:carbamoyl phosphate synthase small subunit [Microaerobacter geothermalis]MCF6093447.1 carbamoyl phosphate synthase small subunit [Microaerobacter geothermalis]
MKGYLALHTGEIFEGEIFGDIRTMEGEVVFNTGMTGYQEVMTDPSYCGQIVTFTYPLLGNYGTNPLDKESRRPALSGIVVGDLCCNPSHYLSIQSLDEMAKEFGLPVLSGIDTRAITRLVRDRGEVYGRITANLEETKGFIGKPTIHPVDQVSTRERQFYPRNGPHVVLVDFGYKASILTSLLESGCSVTVVHYQTRFQEIEQIHPDGIVFSNGPGNPKDLLPYMTQLKKMVEAYPTLGICLGHQVIALIFGGNTERLPYGHRGSNHPVKELTTGKVYITSQNHGYVVTDDSVDRGSLMVTYRNVNDGSIEGLKHRFLPIMSVQFHPEAHPGPNDTAHIFSQFIQQCLHIGEKSYA